MKRRRYAVPAILLATLLAVSGLASANNWDNDPSTTRFNPDLFITNAVLVNSYTNLDLKVNQNRDEDVIGSYAIHIPTGFKFAVGSVPAATISACKDIDPTSTDINDHAEAVGPAQILLETDETAGRVQYLGELYFLKFASNVATFCALVGSSDFTIPTENQQLVFQVDLTYNADRSWDVAWNLASVDPLTPGWHSIYDNSYFQTHKVSIENASIEFSGNTLGNYHVDPGTGKHAKIPFAQNPSDVGQYEFVSTLVPCGQNGTDATYACRSNAPVAHPTELVGIGSSISGTHNLPLVQSPELLFGSLAKPITGTSLVTVTWKPPVDTPAADIKGYLVTTGIPYQPSQIHYDYLITNPALPGYSAASDPCGNPDLCSKTFDFKTLRTTKGELFNEGRVDGLYSTSVVALFADGHRSDGKCDDGTPQGAKPPCAHGETPQYYFPGWTYVQYIMRYHHGRDWPLQFSTSLFIGPCCNPTPVFVLVDLDAHEAEFLLALPYAIGYPMVASTITGSNALGAGGIMYLDNTNTDGKRFGMQAYIQSGQLSGEYETFVGPAGATCICGINATQI